MALHCFLISGALKRYQGGRWPDATRDESGCLLEIRFRNRPGLLRRGKPGISRLYLEIRDYPGEWLLDLPLLVWITVLGVLNATPSLTVPCACLLAGVLSKN